MVRIPCEAPGRARGVVLDASSSYANIWNTHFHLLISEVKQAYSPIHHMYKDILVENSIF